MEALNRLRGKMLKAGIVDATSVNMKEGPRPKHNEEQQQKSNTKYLWIKSERKHQLSQFLRTFWGKESGKQVIFYLNKSTKMNLNLKFCVLS